MNITDIPSKILKAFGLNGQKNTIPVDSSTASDSNGVATFDKGFPPITMQPLSAGGKPPSGKDMNGILNAITIQQQWQNAGGSYPFDASFASAVGGYPSGAFVPASDYSGYWQNTADGNSTNPENLTGSTTGWVPHAFYGSSAISVSSANVTLSTLQAARDELVLSGTLTGNRYLYVPSWLKSWRIINNCTGNYAVLVSTSSGTITVQSYPGTTMNMRCDGTNIYKVQPSLLSTPGYQYLDSGLIIQWGDVGVAPGNAVTVALPVSFQNGSLIAVASKGSSITNADYSCGIDVTKTSITITNGNNASGGTTSQGIRWVALGF